LQGNSVESDMVMTLLVGHVIMVLIRSTYSYEECADVTYCVLVQWRYDKWWGIEEIALDEIFADIRVIGNLELRTE